jgi:hypothetical protein
MSAIDHVLFVFRMNVKRFKILTEDITEAEFFLQPAGLNHPAWILGHVAAAREWVRDLLKLPERANWDGPRWLERFNRGSSISADPKAYPSKAEILAALDETHRELEAVLTTLTEADLAREMPDPKLRERFPRVGDLLVGLATMHEAFHMGQLSAWRRAMGRKPLF